MRDHLSLKIYNILTDDYVNNNYIFLNESIFKFFILSILRPFSIIHKIYKKIKTNKFDNIMDNTEFLLFILVFYIIVF